MKPNYRFVLMRSGTTTRLQVHPIYGDDCVIKWAHDGDEKYFRQSFSGTLVFVNRDYSLIYDADISTQFRLVVYNDTQEVWRGKFFKTDCEFDVDNQTCSVKPEMTDVYADVLAGIEKKFDLIKLLPPKQPIYLDKRSMLQIYAEGEDNISCFFQGMTWEQQCEAVDDETKLKNTYKFGITKSLRIVNILNADAVNPEMPDVFYGENKALPITLTSGSYFWRLSYLSSGSYYPQIEVGVTATKQVLWRYVAPTATIPDEFVLTPVAGTGASGNLIGTQKVMNFYARYLCDVDEVTIGGTEYTTSALPSDDMVSDNRNFRRVMPYIFDDVIIPYDKKTTEISEWFYKDDLYYQKPPHGGSTGIRDYYPIAQTYWGKLSYWFRFDLNDSAIEPLFRKEYELKDAYPLWAVIDYLLTEILKDSSYIVSFYGQKKYSEFLYGDFNPITQTNYKLFLSQKSNLLAGEYSQPAQKAEITLRQVLDMLRDVFRCYWWIEWDNEEGEYDFRIEHIEYFMNGGAYFTPPKVGIDLTQLVNPRTGKAWSWGVNQVKYDKDELPERYEFGWADETTSYFEGNTIEINDEYVKEGNIESISIANFNSDVDYMLLNPSVADKDGFALLSAVESEGKWKVPYYTINDDTTLQNGFLAFYALQRFYMYDMPAWDIVVNNETTRSIGVKKCMTQSVLCPYRELDLSKLVKTGIGNGQIDAVQMNLDTLMLEISLIFTPK